MDIEKNPENKYKEQQFQQPQNFANDFKRQARLGFIRKVFGIICFQLSITTLLCAISMYVPKFSNFQRLNPWLFYLCIAIEIATLIVIICFKKAAKQTPYNYILLTIFTLAVSYFVSYFCSLFEPAMVLQAAICTLGVTIGLTLYALFTKTDFTMLGGTLFVAGFALVIMGIFMGISGWSKTTYILYNAIGVILYGIYLVYDVQLLAGGKSNELSIDDYIIASIQIYMDVIMLFLKILSIFGASK